MLFGDGISVQYGLMIKFILSRDDQGSADLFDGVRIAVDDADKHI